MKIDSLEGKKILFFAPGGEQGRYASDIKEELLTRGADVVLYPERPSLSTFQKVFIRLIKNAIPIYFNLYIKNILEKYKSKQFDYLLVVRGEAFLNSTINIIKSYHPSIITIVYFWDIFLTNNKSNIIKSFDKAFSFDYKDCRENERLFFRPLFFLDRHIKIAKKETKKIDFFFAGTMHSNRYTILEEFKKNVVGKSVFFYYYLPSKLLFYKDKLVTLKYKLAKRKDFNFNMLNEKELYDKMADSKSIVDVIYPGQESLSIRALEALGSKSKLITDFEGIKNYDFFNSQNILIFNPESFKVDFDFIETQFQPIDSSIIERYTVKAWVDDIFFNKSEPKDFFKQPN
jgi:hypothetical protein